MSSSIEPDEPSEMLSLSYLLVPLLPLLPCVAQVTTKPIFFKQEKGAWKNRSSEELCWLSSVCVCVCACSALAEF